MKKVRYAIGAIGMAPALALPLNHAATAKPHAAGKASKRVSLAAALRPDNPAAPDVSCFHQARDSNRASSADILHLFADWDGHDCVFAARGSRHGNPGVVQPSAMRVRLRSHPNGMVVYSKVDTFTSHPSFSSYNWTVSKINHSGTQLCIAIFGKDIETGSKGEISQPICVATSTP